MEEINASVNETLKEIAALLRQQQQSDETIDKINEDSRKQMGEIRLMAESRQKEQDAKRQQYLDEERAFRENLLSELKRHNELLAEIARRLPGSL